ncbi:hypothetical protein [Fulvimarina endophytica]|nr:hypothetical protein [Fulvimarina endophytica]
MTVDRERRRLGRHDQPRHRPGGEGEARRVVLDDHEVEILRNPDADRRDSFSWSLVSSRNGYWYVVDYVGTPEQAERLARGLVAPNVASHGIRTAFELRTVNLTADVTLATGQASIELPLLRVLIVPDDSLFRAGNVHRLSLNPGIVIPSDAAERSRNEARGRESASYAAVIEERDARMWRACGETAEPPTTCY